jgi:Subtilase family/PatG C-terminal
MNNQLDLNIPLIPGVREIWLETRGTREVCIALLDGPVKLDHPCFAGANLSTFGLLNDQSVSEESLKHGTHVASLIFGQHDSVLSGFAPDCLGLIFPIFTDDNGTVSDSILEHAINMAGHAGANIINISAGRPSNSLDLPMSLQGTIRYWTNKGVLIIAAAGNDGCDQHGCTFFYLPAALQEVLAVGASDNDGNCLSLSNWNAVYDGHGLLARGSNLVGADLDGETVARSGTSFATASVSGVAALLMSLQRGRGQTPNGNVIRNILLDSIDDKGLLNVSNCRKLIDDFDFPRMPSTNSVQGASSMIQPTGQRTSDDVSPLGKHESIAPSSPESLPIPNNMSSRSFSLQGCGCGGSTEGSTCSCGTTQPPAKPILVLGIGTLEAAFRSDSQVRYFKEHGPDISFEPFDQQSIGRLLIADRCRPAGALFLPPYLSWASELAWYLRVRLPRKLVIQPIDPWVDIKYRALAHLLASVPDDTLPKCPDPIPSSMGVPPELYDPLYSELAPTGEKGEEVKKQKKTDQEALEAKKKETKERILRLTRNSTNLLTRYIMVAGHGLKGPRLTVVDPVVEGFYEWDIIEIAFAIYDEIPTLTFEQLLKLISTMQFIFTRFANEGVTDEGRAINAAIVRAIRFILNVIVVSGSDWELRTLTSAPTEGRSADDKIWDITITYVNVKNFALAPIQIVLQVDVTDVLPTLIGAYQTQGVGV